jgi:hypothetical protein
MLFFTSRAIARQTPITARHHKLLTAISFLLILLSKPSQLILAHLLTPRQPGVYLNYISGPPWWPVLTTVVLAIAGGVLHGKHQAKRRAT